MKKMNKMIFRELLKSKGQFIAAAAIVFAGVSIFLAAYMSFKNLKNSADYFYEKYQLLDYYAAVNKASPEVLEQVKRIDGIKDAIGRISKDVTAEMSAENRVVLQMISVPDGEQPRINSLYVNSGTYFSAADQSKCLLNQRFAAYYKLKPGDTIQTLIGGVRHRFTIAGTVSSPEYVDAVKSESEMSEGTYGILYVKESEVRALFHMDGIYNQIHVQFDKNADKKQAIAAIEEQLKPAGFTEGFRRDQLLSFNMLNNDIEQVQELAVIFPILFLTVAAAVIYVSQKRMIGNQRTLIGVMKALGYSRNRILSHYVFQALFIALAGCALGIISGLFLGKALTGMYTTIHNIPVMRTSIYWELIAVGAGLCIFFSIVASYNAAKKIIRIVPAEAMRQEAPKAGKRIFLEKVGFFWRRLPFGWKVSIRNIFRSRSRTIFTGMGAIFTIMIFIVVFFLMDTVGNILDYHFKEFQKQDYKVMFSKPLDQKTMNGVLGLKEVTRVEPLLEIPVQIVHDGKKETLMMSAMKMDTQLYNLEKKNGQKIQLPKDGLVVSTLAAKKLSIHKGDTVAVSSMLEPGEIKNIQVKEIVNQVVGIACYISMESLSEGGTSPMAATGALIKIKDGMDKEVKTQLYQNPAVDSLEGRQSSYESFLKLLDFLYLFVYVMIGFGSIMGFATIYNTTVINIGERRRELASLKVLGYKRMEIEKTILRENMIIGILSFIPGVPLGIFMSKEFAEQMNSQNLILDVVISPRTYLITAVSVIAFILLAQLANRRNISGLDMVEVLNNREG